MKIFGKHGHIIGGGLLISGTMVGVGMLALPVVTGPGGFLPSILIYFLCWAFMLCTGLLFLEVCTWMPKESNLISMAERLLGKPGKIICWLVYLFLFETVMIAHVTGGGRITSELLPQSFGLLPSMFFYVLLFAPIIYMGAKTVDRLNLVMFSGVLISYFCFVFISIKFVDLQKLSTIKFGKAILALPVLFTAFTYQVIIPTLYNYMGQNAKKVRTAILLGTTVPLFMYLLWQVLILGIIPIDGANGLLAAEKQGLDAVTPLKHFVQSPLLVSIGKAFAFFTMTASYIALSLAFFDFMADGLKIKKAGMGKLSLCLIIFIPPLFVSFVNPDIFLKALGYAGGISCAILFGIYPPLMVWIGRYKKGYTTGQQMPGGRLFLSFLILFIILELGLELFRELVG